MTESEAVKMLTDDPFATFPAQVATEMISVLNTRVSFDLYALEAHLIKKHGQKIKVGTIRSFMNRTLSKFPQKVRATAVEKTIDEYVEPEQPRMKDFDYYRNIKAKYYSGTRGDDSYEKRLTKRINSLRLTQRERDKMLSEVKQRAIKWQARKNKPYGEERRRLDEEFWQDARNVLGYDQWLDDDGVKLLESKAYEDGHSHGYSEVYFHLDDLVDFIEKMKSHIK